MVDFLEDNANSNKNKNDKKNSKNYHYMPETYNECKDRFGIIFHDKLSVSDLLIIYKITIHNLKYLNNINQFSLLFYIIIQGLKEIVKEKQHCTLYNNTLTSVPIEQYPFTSANKVY